MRVAFGSVPEPNGTAEGLQGAAPDPVRSRPTEDLDWQNHAAGTAQARYLTRRDQLRDLSRQREGRIIPKAPPRQRDAMGQPVER